MIWPRALRGCAGAFLFPTRLRTPTARLESFLQNSAPRRSLMKNCFQTQEIDMRETRTLYEQCIVAWANEQAEFIRSGQLDLLDRAHIADEIEDVGKSERRELANRMAVLLAHLLKWQFQPGRRGASWQRTIKEQRRAIAL